MWGGLHAVMRIKPMTVCVLGSVQQSLMTFCNTAYQHVSLRLSFVNNVLSLILHVLAPRTRVLLNAVTDVGHARACEQQADGRRCGEAAIRRRAGTLQQMQQFVSLRTDLQRLASHLSLAPNLIQCARSPSGQPLHC